MQGFPKNLTLAQLYLKKHIIHRILQECAYRIEELRRYNYDQYATNDLDNKY